MTLQEARHKAKNAAQEFKLTYYVVLNANKKYVPTKWVTSGDTLIAIIKYDTYAN